MAYVDLDKVINVNWGGGWIYPDVPYPVLNQRIGIFNKPDARDTDSNGWFGLLGNSVAGICQQNYNFNQQIALAVDSWVGALSTRVKSYDFSTDIDKIDGGAIKWGIFSRGTNFFNINETSKKIKDVYSADQTISLSSSTKKWFIVTSWGNRFLLTALNSYSLDSNNIIQSSTPTWTYLWQVLAVVWNTVWTTSIDTDVTTNTLVWRIYTVDSAWSFTLIDSQVMVTQNFASWSYPKIYNKEQCQWDNTIAYIVYNFLANFWGMWYLWKAWALSVDLSNTWTFTSTSVYQDTSWTTIGATLAPVCWYDTWVLYVGDWDVYRITWAWKSASLWTYVGTINDISSKANSVSLLTTLTDNIITQSTKLTIKWTDVWWDSITTIYDKVCFVYEPTGTQSQDDSFVGILTNLTTIWETDTLTLSINSTLVETIENVLYNNWYWKTFTLPQIILGTPAVEVQLDYANTLGNDLKLWIGITGWTYATPTLPANNGMSAWNQTTARTAGSDASYIDLTLST